MKKNRREFLKLAFISSLLSIGAPAGVSYSAEKLLGEANNKASKSTNISLPTGERWLSHLQNDLLPFWDMPSALGNPVGNFPSVRCNNGALLDRANPCPEIQAFSWLLLDRTYVVSLSRQTYGYGVAFHLTGDRKYLEYAKAGVNYLRQNAFDRTNGGAYSYRDNANNTWGPAVESRNAQELAYSLLGISFYYYLTRDPELLPDIISIKNYIFERYENPSLGTFQWTLETGPNSTAQEKHLTAVLDQLNSYMVLLTPVLPEPQQSQWKQDMLRLAGMMRTEFYSSADNLFFLRGENKNLATTDCDFGHTIKSMWMFNFIGLITGNTELVNFAKNNGKRVLERAYLTSSGSWASQLNQGGSINPDKSWWIYAELDQFASSLAVKDSSVAAYVSRTYDYWFQNFVDPQYGEVWTGLDANTNRPKPDDLPKQWPWKNAYHSFEHALVGYITAQQRQRQSIVLYYAFKQVPNLSTIHPYFYRSNTRNVESLPNQTNKVTFR